MRPVRIGWDCSVMKIAIVIILTLSQCYLKKIYMKTYSLSIDCNDKI